ncbi:MAG TPA: hypothetical protein H9786_14110 [Candidatus Brachybacterium merdavium]|uniref:Uncharacterized protein n=1 Tax=Candidatus Brachybacterium merdavium TaxID=2838513 RepID=A0A9D2LFP0_9MICO|nr:hypothetical protein [Candidatus Brachybacterium merdavium]
MNTSPDDRERPGPRDMDAEFARMLEQEGLELGPGQPPREPPAGDHPPSTRPPDGSAGPDDELWGLGPDSPADPAGTESRARSRAAHPAAGGPGRDPQPPAELDEDDFLSDDEVIYGDFEPPDPDLPEPSGGALWSWTALIGGFLLMVTATVTPSLPGFLGWLGGAAAIGGVVALLLRVPRTPRDDDGAQV